jgi:hypothetical protein
MSGYRSRLCVLLLPLLLTACHRGDAAATANPAEAQALNDAAASLDANSVDMNAPAPNATDDEDQPQ